MGGERNLRGEMEPSQDRLTELAAEFRKFGGDALVGDDAWRHIEAESGATMAIFIEKYVRLPIAKMDESNDELLSLAISAQGKSKFSIAIRGQKESYDWEIERREDPALETEPKDEPE